jgi:hypothetical protein
VFGWFLFVACYVCLIFAIQFNNVDELGWVMEWFPSLSGKCSWIWLLLIMMLGDGWWVKS